MPQRQHWYHIVARMQTYFLMNMFDVWYNAPVRKHDTFWISCRSRSIIDDGQLFQLFASVRNILCTEAARIAFPELFVQVLAGISQLFRAWNHQIEVLQFDDTFQVRHGRFVEVLPYLIAYKQHAGLRMVYYIMYIVCFKFVKDRYSHRSVGDYSKECSSPVGTVSAAECDFISFLYACMFQQNMHFFYLARYILIL